MVSFHVTWTLQESVKYLKRSWYQLVFWLWHLKFKEICLFSAGFASCIMRQVEYMSKRPHYQNAPYQNAPTFYQNAPVLLPKRPHYFFRIKIILPKRPHLFIAKTARLIFFFYSNKCGHRNVLSKRQVWMSIFHIINFKKIKIMDTGVLDFFLIKN